MGAANRYRARSLLALFQALVLVLLLGLQGVAAAEGPRVRDEKPPRERGCRDIDKASETEDELDPEESDVRQEPPPNDAICLEEVDEGEDGEEQEGSESEASEEQTKSEADDNDDEASDEEAEPDHDAESGDPTDEAQTESDGGEAEVATETNNDDDAAGPRGDQGEADEDDAVAGSDLEGDSGQAQDSYEQPLDEAEPPATSETAEGVEAPQVGPLEPLSWPHSSAGTIFQTGASHAESDPPRAVGPDRGDKENGAVSTLPLDEAQILLPGIAVAAPSGYQLSGTFSSAALLDALPPKNVIARRNSIPEVSPFIIAGPASWTNTWGAPRFGPGSLIRTHEGQDVFCRYGDPVLASESGTLEFDEGGLGGKVARIRKEDGSYWYYAHLSSWNHTLVSGDRVAPGDVIGYCGDSGNAAGTSPHVHLGFYGSDGRAIDPMPFLVKWLRAAERGLKPPLPGRQNRIAPAPRSETDSRRIPVIPRLFGRDVFGDRSSASVHQVEQSLAAAATTPLAAAATTPLEAPFIVAAAAVLALCALVRLSSQR
ncbi:MAG TPA: peptidoglycan DD-metalloendopeptidase family protein [Actinomycetota bacterium]|nr:peptidoglycan DD-metalloendopeptidase family protein [Actinomycetota bacterium]